VRVADQAHRLPHPALAASAVDYAEFLLDLTEQIDPLERTITIACTGAARDVQRRAAGTAEALATVGSRCKILDAAEVTAALTAATDPFSPGTALTPRTPPQASVRLAQQPHTRYASDSDDDDPRLTPGNGHDTPTAVDDPSDTGPFLSERWAHDQATVATNGRGRWVR
jgi:hypothetical protein